MPAIANITVKKNDNTTDIVWTGVNPSSGDKTPALYQSLTVGVAEAHRPWLLVSAAENGSGNARRMRLTGGYPQIATDTTTGLVTVVNKGLFEASFLQPKSMPATELNEFVSQMAHLLASTALKDIIKSGRGPT